MKNEIDIQLGDDKILIWKDSGEQPIEYQYSELNLSDNQINADGIRIDFQRNNQKNHEILQVLKYKIIQKKEEIERRSSSSSVSQSWGKLILIGGTDMFSVSHRDSLPNNILLPNENHTVLIGRFPTSAHSVICRPYMDDLHFGVTRSISNPKEYHVHDYSVNGTYLNDQLIGNGNSRQLSGNDCISIHGHDTVRYLFQASEGGGMRKRASQWTSEIFERQVRPRNVSENTSKLEILLAESSNPCPSATFNLNSSFTALHALRVFFLSRNLTPENCRVWRYLWDSDPVPITTTPRVGRRLTTDITDTVESWQCIRDINCLQSNNRDEIMMLMIEQKIVSPDGQTSWPKDPALRQWLFHLKVGDIVDGRDQCGEWYESKISSVNYAKPEIVLHYMGWGANFDRRLNGSLIETEIAPLYTHTKDWRSKVSVGDIVEVMPQVKDRKWYKACVTDIARPLGCVSLQVEDFPGPGLVVELFGESICSLGTHIKHNYPPRQASNERNQRTPAVERTERWKYFQVGRIIDARDHHGTWSEAVISSVNKHSGIVKVHFLGWGKMHDLRFSGHQLDTNIADAYTHTENWRSKLNLKDIVEYLIPDNSDERNWTPALVIARTASSIQLLYIRSGQRRMTDLIDLYSDSICKVETHVSWNLLLKHCVLLSEPSNVDERTNSNSISRAENTSPAPTPCAAASNNREESSCIICFEKPKNATFIHGKTGHTCCCIECAEVLFQKQSPCPICRESITAVIENFHS